MAISLKEIEAELKSTVYGQESEFDATCARFVTDERVGVQNLLKKYARYRDNYQEELLRIEAMLFFEHEYREGTVIAGIDEAGRGPLAGPVVAAAVILPKDVSHWLYVNDSKQVSEKKREELFDIITREAVSYGVGIVTAQRIDEINILQATYEAMRIAVSQLQIAPEVLLNDAVTIPRLQEVLSHVPNQRPIIKGDAKSLSIAAASIVAKVTRDRMMREYDQLYPEYGFAGHKGYGSKAHMDAIREFGPCPIHRQTFIKGIIQ